MLVDFRQTFGEGVETCAELPAAVVRELSKTLPRNTRYYSAGGKLVMGPEQGAEMQIDGFAPEITDDMQKVLGRNPSLQKVLDYSYNAQKALHMKLSDPGFIIVNGDSVPVGDIVKDVKQKDGIVQVKDGLLIMYPEAFPQPHRITVSTFDERSTLELFVRRVPSESLAVEKYESDPQEAFVMRYDVFKGERQNDDRVRIRYDFSARPSQCASLSEVVTVLRVLQALTDGSGRIAGVSLGQADMSDVNVDCDFSILPWLEKAIEVESVLGLTFDPKDIVISIDSVRAIAELYEGLVRKRPMRMSVDHAEVNVDDEAARALNERREGDLTSLVALTYSRTHAFDLFGHKIELQSFCGLFGLALSGVKAIAKGKYRVDLVEPPDSAEGYVSWILFRDESELEEFLKLVPMSDVMEQLQGAVWLDGSIASD